MLSEIIMYRVTVLMRVSLIPSVGFIERPFAKQSFEISNFNFSLWCEANGISSKTAEILKDQDRNVEEALKLLTQDDIAELGLIKSYNLGL